MGEKFDQAAYVAAYNKENYASVNLKISKKLKAEWDRKAKAAGMSLTALIKKRMEDDEK